MLAIGVDAVYPLRQLQQGRNRLFAAFTRAKAWLRVSGVGENAQAIVDEISTAKRHAPGLDFVYPNPKEILTIQRDLTDQQSEVQRTLEEFHRRMAQLGISETERDRLLRGMRQKT